MVVIFLDIYSFLFFWQLKKQHSEYKKENINVVESMREGNFVYF
jgi:hypothetical protein